MNSIYQKCQSKKPISQCSSKNISVDSSNLAILVDDYLQQYGNSYDWEDKWWGDKNLTWSEAIERAWRSLMENGKMHGHQCNVGKQKLDEGFQICLSHNRQPDSFNNFHDIYCWIESITRSTYRLGSLTTYDVARRLGVWLDMQPTMVYLHAGAAKGAKKLGIEGEIVSLNDFSREIQKLGATHAENFLCWISR